MNRPAAKASAAPNAHRAIPRRASGGRRARRFGTLRSTAIWSSVALWMFTVGALVVPANADATSSAAAHITTVCEASEEVPRGYTAQDYREALQHLSEYAIEYSNCAEIIVQAEREGAGHRQGGPTKSGGGNGTGIGGSGSSTPTGGGGTPASTPATPEEQQAIAHAQKHTPSAVALGSGPTAAIHPGVVHAGVSTAFKSLPGPLIAAILAIAALILLLLGRAARDRMRLADEEV